MPPAVRSAALARMKWLAFGLLVAAGLLYLFAQSLRARHPAWGYLAAFSEAAMVGAIADWFAVVALFRRPLGLPIPHTAIIPTNKDRIGENLATFICANFLSTSQVLDKIERFGVATRLANWLADRRHAEQAATQLGAVVQYALDALDDRRVQHFFRTTLLDQLQRVDAAWLTSRLLDALTADRRHQVLLDALLRQLTAMLDHDVLKKTMAEVVAHETRFLRLVGLDSVAGRYATAKIVKGVTRLAAEVTGDPEHPLRLAFDDYVVSLVARLQEDPELRAKVGSIQRDLLANPALAGYLQGLWSEVVAWIRLDFARPDSVLRERAVAGIQHVGEQLRSDTPMQAWIDEQLMAAAPRWIERYREDIRRTIVARVVEWNADEMSTELERNIGRDLQFIRINGTLVGGLVGLAIHAATRWMQAG